jgi:hypothetical protein
MPFDAEWFNELRELTQGKLEQTKARGIDQDHLVPHVGDLCPLDGWRFFAKRLSVRDPEDNAIIGSHERLRDAAVEVYAQIKAAGFGM